VLLFERGIYFGRVGIDCRRVRGLLGCLVSLLGALPYLVVDQRGRRRLSGRGDLFCGFEGGTKIRFGRERTTGERCRWKRSSRGPWR
jgi:hypothetical protein